jgi:hypothetical protein
MRPVRANPPAITPASYAIVAKALVSLFSAPSGA